ncbi:MAG: hypothetical protein ACKO15_00945 [Burkholderiales bacterium]
MSNSATVAARRSTTTPATVDRRGLGITPAALASYVNLLPPTLRGSGVAPVRMPGTITTAMCLNFYDAGWNAIRPSADMIPDRWLRETVKHYLEGAEAEAKKPFGITTDDAYGLDMVFGVGVNEGCECAAIVIGTASSADGLGYRIADNERRLRPYIEFLAAADLDLARAVLRCLARNYAIVTPETVVDMIRHFSWLGEDDESLVVEEYTDLEIGMCQYGGITREEVDATYPRWLQEPWIKRKDGGFARRQRMSREKRERLARHRRKDVREALALVEAVDSERAAHKEAANALFAAEGYEEVRPEEEFLPTIIMTWDGEGMAHATVDMANEYAMQGGATDAETISSVDSLIDPVHVRHLVQYLTGRMKILAWQSVLLDRIAKHAIQDKRSEECQSS